MLVKAIQPEPSLKFVRAFTAHLSVFLAEATASIGTRDYGAFKADKTLYSACVTEFGTHALSNLSAALTPTGAIGYCKYFFRSTLFTYVLCDFFPVCSVLLCDIQLEA